MQGSMVQFDVDEDRLCAEDMMSEDVSSGDMCRTCFSSFARYFKKSGSEKQAQEPVLRKRPRLAQNVSRSSLAGSVGETSQSPPVSV